MATRTSFEVAKYLRYFRHLTSMHLLSYRDSMREANLTVPKPQRIGDRDEKPIIGNARMVDIIDTTRPEGRYLVKGTQDTAMNHHIAVNLILKERGFTEAIDNPELTIDMGLLKD